ncbi:MAG: alanine--tRNA ligase [Alphaproteobacteria bacterium]|nr:alanine--tRNA ligase [Alphaproteobacteria bacterium]|tara:strand:+ start:11523 stop:14171 length:2649 start_codon:yes stop_codon:yes gene_type:complete
MTSTADIRKAFIDYFAAHGHEPVVSSPLVPHNDPTLLFTNAGMVQFKNVFTGVEARDYNRAVTSQKCVRAGGKHNDLDNVGYTARHHTFFEMLGNFSFGDYFKDLAIELAWNLITKEFGLPTDRLLATVYAEDDQAFDLWKKIAGLPEDRIIRIPTSDNFWAMGPTGPCGPCSEIFYDHGEHIEGGPPGSPEEDGDRFTEIWNLVFMQYEQISEEQRVDLPKPSIDTGMGLERIAAVLQGKHDNYDIDLMRSLIEASAEASGQSADADHAVSHRVIADHLRSVSFLIADGVLPSNEGRGYVLRRIMRRAMRHAHMMGCKDPLLWRLVPELVAQMSQAFPELGRAEPLITETLKLEETRFRQTLERGLRLLEEEIENISEGNSLSGDVAFRLYDTYGFPLDLTQDALRNRGIDVDTDGFDVAMERQREEARKAWAGSGDVATDALWFEVRERVGATEFLGYETDTAEARVEAIVMDGSEVESAPDGADAVIVVNQTPFYGESGGQMGDSGVMFTAEGAEVVVTDTQKHLGDVHAHKGSVKGGTLNVGDVVELRVNAERRQRLRSNHSATHLMHAALRRTLGDHVIQKGSLVAPDRLRFDFAHPKAVDESELQAIESDVNANIRCNANVGTVLMSPDEAVENGALALFGEKYGDEVRVVRMGGDEGAPNSVELCGGTHVDRAGDIGFFKIIGEVAVAAGVRRVEALTGLAAADYVHAEEQALREVAAELKASPSDLPERVRGLIKDRKRLEQELADARRKLATGGTEAGPEAKDVAGIRYIGQRVDGASAKDLKVMVDDLKQSGEGIYAIVAVNEGKASLVVGVTGTLEANFDAVELVKSGAHAVGGKGGGGRSDMAQAGGPDGSKADEALSAIEEEISSRAAA